MSGNKGSTDGTPGRTHVLSAVDRILSSAAIGTGSRLPSLLRYVVCEELEGRGDRLKAYTIGTDVCGKPAGFDPQSDSSVRVEMGRLRKALSDFYEAEAPADLAVIDIPVGTYRPEFRWPGREAAAPAADEGPVSAGRGSFFGRPWPAAGLILVALLGLLVLADTRTGPAAGKPPLRIAISDFGSLPQADSTDVLARSLSFVVQRELAAVRWLSVYRLSPAGPERGKPKYRIVGAVAEAEGKPELTVRLLEGRSGKTLYSDAVGVENGKDGHDRGIIGPSVGIGLAVAIARAEGDLGGALPKGGPAWSAAAVGHEGFRCFLRVYDLPLGLAGEDGSEIASCLKAFTEDNPEFASGWAARSLVALNAFGHDEGTDARLLREAVAALDTAVRLDPADPLVLKARYTMALMRPERDMPRFHRYAAEAMKRTPQDPDLLADIANKLAFYGDDPREAAALKERALALNTQPPGWYWWAPTVLALLEGNHAGAYAYSLRIESLSRRQLECIRAITSAMLGLTGEVTGHIAALEELGVDSLEDTVGTIRSLRLSVPVEAAMLNGARRAYEIAARARGGAGETAAPARSNKPVVYIKSDGDPASSASILADEFRAMVAGFDYVGVSAGDTWRVGRNAWPEEYLLRLHDSAFDERLHMELVHLRTGVIVATDRLPRMEDAGGSDDDAYLRAAVRLFSKRGYMIAHYLTLEDISTEMRCMASTWNFIRAYSKEAHRAALACTENLQKAGTKESLIYTYHALLLFENYLRAPSEEAGAIFGRALASARRAAELSPASRSAHAILAWLFHLAGQPERQEYHSRLALSGFVVDPDVIALTARPYCLTGRADICLDRMRRAAGLDTVSPAWHDTQRYFGYYAKGDMARARAYARLLSQEDAPLSIVARAVSAFQLSQFDAARNMLVRLPAIDPVFAHAPKQAFERQRFSPGLMTALLRDLAAAGLDDPSRTSAPTTQVQAAR